MKITKYAHACVVLEEQGQKLIIDPGSFTDDFGDIQNVAAVVITHVHGDHYNAGHLLAIVNANPGVQIFGTEEVASNSDGITVNAVTGGQAAQVGPFALSFYGGTHALIHATIPVAQNIGVLVNNDFYYGGDSYSLPIGMQVHTLALPACAPWLKLGDAMDFLLQVKPQVCFPTHNALLSSTGQNLVDTLIGTLCQNNSIRYESLKPGQTVEL